MLRIDSRLDFQDSTGKTSSYNINALPSYLMERLTLLRYFAQYMDENLTEGGDSQQDQTSPVHRRRSFVHMKRWVRTPKAIIMQLDNNTLQVGDKIHANVTWLPYFVFEFVTRANYLFYCSFI